VRIERVVLEHHRDVAVLRGEIVDQALTDVDLARGDLLEPRDHPEGGGLAAAGRSDQDHELLVLDLEIHVADRDHLVELLRQILEDDLCHATLP
jgi:hypothetical protein